MPIAFASAYLAGALLSCVLPIALLIGMVSWFVRSAGRVPATHARAVGSADAPSPTPPDEPPGAPGRPVAGRP
jgi:hypothetical protein